MTSIAGYGSSSGGYDPAAGVPYPRRPPGQFMGQTSAQPQGTPTPPGSMVAPTGQPQAIGGNGPGGTTSGPWNGSGGGVPAGGFNPQNRPNFGGGPYNNGSGAGIGAEIGGRGLNLPNFGGGAGQMMPPQTGVSVSGGGPIPAPNQPNLNRVFQTGNVGGVTSFGPGNSLIGAQINPTTDSRLAGVQNDADTARGRYTGFQEGQYGPIGADTSQSDALYKELLGMARGGGSSAQFGGGFSLPPELTGDIGRLTKEIGQGPDRAKLASDAYNLFLERSAPQDEQLQRSIGQRAAALGRVGSGVTTNELGDLGLSIERTRDQARRELANTAAGQTLSDRLQSLNALQGVAGSLGSGYAGAARQASEADNQRFNRIFDLTRDISGRESDRYGRAVGERNFAAGREGELYGRRRGEFGDLMSAEGQLFGQGQLSRDELRGERGYQGALERDAIARRGAQRQAEEASLDASERRRLAEAGLLGDAGGQAPTDLLAGIGGQQSAAGGQAVGAATDWLSNYLLQRQQQRGAPQQPLVPRTPVYIPQPNIPDYQYDPQLFG